MSSNGVVDAVSEELTALLTRLAELADLPTDPADDGGAACVDRIALLATDLPCTRALLVAGKISEQLAEHVVSLTSHLDPDTRRLVDKQIADTGLDQLGRRAAEAAVKKLAYEADPVGFTQRGRTAREDRRVTLRPAPDTMSVLSGLLPVEQGVACLAALRRHADALIATGDTDDRTRDQTIADTLVERLTGQVLAEDVNVEVGIVLPLDALLDPQSPKTAELVGHGPLPGGIVTDLLHVVHDGHGDRPHAVVTTTATGHTYTSRAGP